MGNPDCYNTVEHRDSVKETVIPPWRWLVSRRVTGKRPPQRSDERKWTGSGVRHLAFSSELPLSLEIGQIFGRMAYSEVANGRCRV